MRIAPCSSPLPPSPSSSICQSPPYCHDSPEVKRLVERFESQPELLALILTSKTEEDRRRAEEARLKQKQIDFALQQDGEPRRHSLSRNLPSLADVIDAKSSHLSTSPKKSSHHYDHFYSTFKSADSVSSVILPPIHVSLSTKESHSRSHPPNYSSSSIPSPLPIHITPLETPQQCSPPTKTNHTPPHSRVDTEQDDDSADNQPTPPKRRRRETQAITAVVETRDFLYEDDYLWKNNGSTVHRAFGQKSIYYKCANYGKGCRVNKTVTFKDSGGYLIKYRGEHLKACTPIKRIIDT